MEYGKLYLVLYKEYKNDSDYKTVYVFAYNEKECINKINKSDLIHFTSMIDNNSGYIATIQEFMTDIL